MHISQLSSDFLCAVCFRGQHALSDGVYHVRVPPVADDVLYFGDAPGFRGVPYCDGVRGVPRSFCFGVLNGESHGAFHVLKVLAIEFM